MGKLNSPTAVARPAGVIQTEPRASLTTFEGGPGFKRDVHSELFLLATTNFVSEDTFYETAGHRDTRYAELVREAALQDPAWTAELLGWLRSGAHMRAASIVGAIEAGRAISASGLSAAFPSDVPYSPRRILDSVLQRADEPADALAYWLTHYGKPLPKWFTRALGDAALRLYDQYTVTKWDGGQGAVKMADVVELSQIDQRARGTAAEPLFLWLLNGRHGRNADLTQLPMLVVREAIMSLPPERRRRLLSDPEFPTMAREAGLTWEAVSGWLGGPMDAAAWQACLPMMGYGALMKNLANFIRAGIDGPTALRVAEKLIDRQRVLKSRLLPLDFLRTYLNVPNDFYRSALDQAATFSLGNITPMPGHTLVLIDTSSSMKMPYAHSRRRFNPLAQSVTRRDMATLFGLALARVCERVDVVSFSDTRAMHDNQRFPIMDTENLLASVQRFGRTHFFGGGTWTADNVKRFYRSHDRIVLLTDEQAESDGEAVFDSVPATARTYTFNLAGYEAAHAPSGPNRYTVGGLSDAGFQMIHALETSSSGRWPWQTLAQPV